MSGSYSETIESHPSAVASLDVEARGVFIGRTYVHLFAAILAFTLLEIALFSTGAAEAILRPLSGVSGRGRGLILFGGFVLAGWLAQHWAHRARSLAMQYAGLALFIAAEAIVFITLLGYANAVAPGVIKSAAFVTLLGFSGLTAVVFMTRKDFSFLATALRFGGILALVAIVAALIFGFELGTFFSVGMVALAGASILYDTSNVLHHHPEDRYVGASLELFASVALMFYYVLRIMLNSRR